MSRYGGGLPSQVSQEVIEAIRLVMREFEGFTRSIQAGSRATDENTKKSRLNWAVGLDKAITGYERETTNSIVSDIAKYGVNSAQDVIDFGVIGGMEWARNSGIPGISDLAGIALQPYEAAGNRTLGVTADVARAGGHVSEEGRRAQFRFHLEEEKRVALESIEVGKLKTAAFARDTLDGADDVTGASEGLRQLRENLGMLNDFLKNMFHPMGGMR